MPVIPVLERLMQKSCQLEVILGYIVRSCSPKKNLIPQGRICSKTDSFGQL